MVTVEEIFKKISSRQFLLPDARELIKRSYYFSDNHAHPDVHIVLTGNSRPADLHFQHLPNYDERALHSMFRSMDDAAAAIAAALNCRAGEAAMRFLSVSSVRRLALYSRSAASHAATMFERAAVVHAGARAGTTYTPVQTEVVVVIFGIHAEQVFVVTAYPCHILPANRPLPPAGHDLLEYRQGPQQQLFTYPAE
jgi:hypothetical protein